MNSILLPILDNLQRGETLLSHLEQAQFSDKSVGPYYSSIGGHFRHILDVFACIFIGLDDGLIDLTARERNELVETNTGSALTYLERTVNQLKTLENLSPTTLLAVVDDLGQGQVTVEYTLGSALCQAHSHAIHHFACIGYVLEQLEVNIPDSRFGYNPTTPEMTG